MSFAAELARRASDCALLFRLGRDVEAGIAMVELIDAALPLFDSRPADQRQRWSLILDQMLDCQERQDWLALADYLDCELVELLQRA